MHKIVCRFLSQFDRENVLSQSIYIPIVVLHSISSQFNQLSRGSHKTLIQDGHDRCVQCIYISSSYAFNTCLVLRLCKLLSPGLEKKR